MQSIESSRFKIKSTCSDWWIFKSESQSKVRGCTHAQDDRGNSNPVVTSESAMARSRDWCFTINNPTAEDDRQLINCQTSADYYIFGKEVGDSGTPHYQGYIQFRNPRTLQGVKRLLSRAHLEPRRGSRAQAIEYCEKEGDWVEFGERPSTPLTQKARWKHIISLAESGDLNTIKEEYPGTYLRYLEKLKSLARPTATILPVLENEWWFGSTGTGKSRHLWSTYPQHYQKELNKWWCGYAGEEVVAIEEWSPKNECTASFLKIWADRYPFTAQIKGGSLLRIRPKKIIILSNYTIDECFPATQDAEPIKRRFKVVNFPVSLWFEQEQEDLDAINTLLSFSQ